MAGTKLPRGRQSKLTADDLSLIRQLDACRRMHDKLHRELSLERIGEKFGVSRQTILRIVNYHYPYEK